MTKFRNESDADQDGIDDQTDILQGALAYVNTKPKYKSKYYENGYPDDGYGVCTDVVAFAMKAAGYDLKALVKKDIEKHPDAYEVAHPDADIDFRRVKNLQVFFKNHARILSTDVFQTEEWQVILLFFYCRTLSLGAVITKNPKRMHAYLFLVFFIVEIGCNRRNHGHHNHNSQGHCHRWNNCLKTKKDDEYSSDHP